MHNIIFIHGLESSGDGFKGQLLRRRLPGCLTPNFTKYTPNKSIRLLFEERMKQLIPVLKEKVEWIIIGSSFGGLMATLFTLKNPSKVSKLILLAPYLSTLILDPKINPPVNVPVIVFHGKYDKIVSIKRSQRVAEKFFTNLIYNKVNDDHSLKRTVEALDWIEITKI